MANMNFTKEEDELIALIVDAVIAGKSKMDIVDNLDDKFADVKATRFDYLYAIGKCRAKFKNSDQYSYKNVNKSFADSNKSKKEMAVEMSQQGKSIPEIAKELELEVHTVEYYLDNAKEVKKAKSVSNRQRVLELTLQGVSNVAIAKRLGIKLHSVETYIYQFRKEGKLPIPSKVSKIPEGCPSEHCSDEIIPFDELVKPTTSDFKADEVPVDKTIIKNAKCVQEGEKMQNIDKNIKPVNVEEFKKKVNPDFKIEQKRYSPVEESNYMKIAVNIAKLVEKKNTDYGSAFDESIDEWGAMAYFLRVKDKYNRAKNLVKNEAQVKDESIKDTLKDIIGYTLLMLNYMEQKEVSGCGEADKDK